MESDANTTARGGIEAIKLGMFLGGISPAIYGLYLILASIEFDSASRTLPNCGTAAAVGILIILIFVPACGAAGAICFSLDSRLLTVLGRIANK
ncbi:MAG: hypothetical protein KDB03_09895 [Planctomycetales bacterium]|nr:hypothetical protein [Planctomycetales bacterium]